MGQHPARRLFRTTIVVGILLLAAGMEVKAQVTSSFDTGVDDWRVVAYPFRAHAPSPATATVSYDASGGNPTGSLRIGDVYGETGVAAPIAYLGDKSAYYGGTLSYDIFLRYTDGVTYPAVVLNAGTRSLYYDTPSPPLNVWSHRVIPLVETGWRVSGSQAPATPADLVLALRNLQGLYIYTEWNTGPDDTNVDNVVLTAGACDFIPDFDHDCDVDTHDLLLFRSCAAGPAVPYPLNASPPVCALIPDAGGFLPADFDKDGDVDADDFGVFQRCYSGENKPADPNCVNPEN